MKKNKNFYCFQTSLTKKIVSLNNIEVTDLATGINYNEIHIEYENDKEIIIKFSTYEKAFTAYKKLIKKIK